MDVQPHPDIAASGKTLTAVDESVVETIVRVARLAWLPKAGGKINCGYRLHIQFEIFRGTISRVDVTGSKPKGEADKRAVLARTIEADRCYLMDRGYAKFTLWNIACLLILIHTGRAPTKRTYEMICLYMSGWASLEELERHIEKLKSAKN